MNDARCSCPTLQRQKCRTSTRTSARPRPLKLSSSRFRPQSFAVRARESVWLSFFALGSIGRMINPSDFRAPCGELWHHRGSREKEQDQIRLGSTFPFSLPLLLPLHISTIVISLYYLWVHMFLANTPWMRGASKKNGEMHRRDFPSKADFSFFHPSFPSYSSHFSWISTAKTWNPTHWIHLISIPILLITEVRPSTSTPTNTLAPHQHTSLATFLDGLHYQRSSSRSNDHRRRILGFHGRFLIRVSIPSMVLIREDGG